MKRYGPMFIGILLFVVIIAVTGCSEQKKANKAAVVPNTTVQKYLAVIEEEEKEPVVEPEVVEPQEEVQPQEESAENKTDNKKENNAGNTSSNNTQQNDNQNSQYPYYIKVNRLANCVTIYKQDDTGAYTIPVKAMVCSVGNPIYKTPTGVFKTSNKYTWRYLYGNQYGQYATRINGPILFHSVPYKSQSNDSLKTDYYNNLGVGDSMGCVRLTCADAKWIYDNCPKGTTVEIYESSDPGPLGKPSAIKIDPNSPYAGWDPTNPNPNNPWRSQKPTISGVTDVTTSCGTTVDLMAHVSAVDWLGNSLTVTVSGTVDFNVSGEYQITYSATDSVGNISHVIAKVVVEETPETPEREENMEEGSNEE